MTLRPRWFVLLVVLPLVLAPAAEEHLIRVGFEPAYGARPLKRAIQREIETGLGRAILQGRVKEGQTVRADYDPKKEEVSFTPA